MTFDIFNLKSLFKNKIFRSTAHFVFLLFLFNAFGGLN